MVTVARCAAVLNCAVLLCCGVAVAVQLCNCAGCRKEMCCAGAMMLGCSRRGKFSDSIENKMCSLFDAIEKTVKYLKLPVELSFNL